jgi:YfiH family protein
MGFYQQADLQYFQFNLFKGQPFFHAVLTRLGGYSKAPYNSLNLGGTVGDDTENVLANHQKIFKVFGHDFDSRFDVWQVHGDDIIFADAPRDLAKPHQRADGIFTDNPAVTLLMRFADCVPILLFDPIKKVNGIIHAGWQGTLKNIAGVAIEKMADCYGSDPGSILAGIGPSICQRCYEVGYEVNEAFVQRFGQIGETFFDWHDQSSHLNLWAANRFNLLKAGVSQIEESGVCTSCNRNLWFSHRGENGKTGRFGVIMRLQDNQ